MDLIACLLGGIFTAVVFIMRDTFRIRKLLEKDSSRT